MIGEPDPVRFGTAAFQVELTHLIADPSRLIIEVSGHRFGLSGWWHPGQQPGTRVRLPGIGRKELFRLGLWLAWRALR